MSRSVGDTSNVAPLFFAEAGVVSYFANTMELMASAIETMFDHVDNTHVYICTWSMNGTKVMLTNYVGAFVRTRAMDDCEPTTVWNLYISFGGISAGIPGISNLATALAGGGGGGPPRSNFKFVKFSSLTRTPGTSQGL